MSDQRPVAVVTGAGRPEGIASAVVRSLADDGWDVAFTVWGAYDDRVYGAPGSDAADLAAAVRTSGGRAVALHVDLERVDSAEEVFDGATAELGAVRALILAHAESVDSDILTTDVASFDRHMAVNARASWLLIRAFARRFPGPFGSGRLIALTSDHTAGNLPYGASKGALDRIVIAAASELRSLGIAANAVNPGPTDTGWIGDALAGELVSRTALGRLGTPIDAANLVRFLCSPEGGWVNGQLLHSNGGFPL